MTSSSSRSDISLIKNAFNYAKATLENEEATHNARTPQKIKGKIVRFINYIDNGLTYLGELQSELDDDQCHQVSNLLTVVNVIKYAVGKLLEGRYLTSLQNYELNDGNIPLHTFGQDLWSWPPWGAKPSELRMLGLGMSFNYL
ncbi:hypothetical protein GOP47_0014314 [Adiantum capillus-veneris]|uniref:Uncharacterized protein n=1 Tax=Adiantum capillus-veneris TaxID=13818 RepID=A0A9D4ZER2_ADICA|nr:hypothetical protein GOP47_0014314 [Adiantum capillus-veneris]